MELLTPDYSMHLFVIGSFVLFVLIRVFFRKGRTRTNSRIGPVASSGDDTRFNDNDVPAISSSPDSDSSPSNDTSSSSSSDSFSGGSSDGGGASGSW